MKKGSKPLHYTDEKILQRPVPNYTQEVSFISSLGDGPLEEGWEAFIPPEGGSVVMLKMKPDSNRYDAMVEWMVRRQAADRGDAKPGPVDLRELAPLWNLGKRHELKLKDCGEHHAGLTYSGPYLFKAIKVWSDAGCQGPHPHWVLEALSPGSLMPWQGNELREPVPREARLLNITFDLTQPLKGQFEQARRLCTQVRDQARFLSGQKTRRRRPEELYRNVLIFTLQNSAGMSRREIAAEIFPDEKPDTAANKVKDILQSVRRELRAALKELSPEQDTEGGE